MPGVETMFCRGRHNLLIIILFLLGILISGYRARSLAPEWPEDLVVYMSGFLTAETHQNPYDECLARSVATENGLLLKDCYSYIYSPAFLPLLEPLRMLNPANFRRLWQYSSLLAIWLGVLLLMQRLQGIRKTVLLATLVLLFSIGGPVISTLRWGQVSGFLFLGLCISISRDMKGVISGLALSPLPITKIGMTLPLIALRGKKAWAGLVFALILLVGVSFLLYDGGIWKNFIEVLGSSAKGWSMSIPGNRSLFSAVSRLVDLSSYDRIDLISLDRAARLVFSEHKAALIRKIGIGISFSYLIVCLSIVTKRFRSRPVIDAVSISVWFAWISIALVPMVYDHYALFMLPLIVEVFRRGKTRYSVMMIFGFAWWTLAPMAPVAELSNALWIFYEALRPMIVLILGILMLKVILPNNNPPSIEQ